MCNLNGSLAIGDDKKFIIQMVNLTFITLLNSYCAGLYIAFIVFCGVLHIVVYCILWCIAYWVPCIFRLELLLNELFHLWTEFSFVDSNQSK